MALGFDHAARLIFVPQTDAKPLSLQTLVNAVREEEASERGIVYEQIIDATGKDELGGGVMTGITAALRQDWRLYFEPGPYQAAIGGGNLADALARVYNTGSPQVLVLSSAAATVVAIGSGVTAQDKVDIARQVLVEARSEPVYADVRRVRGYEVVGSGRPDDPWGPA